jgi:glycosyltransferase involved in cell wall biosynthesis
MDVGGTELNALRTARHLVAAGVDLRLFSINSDPGTLSERYAALGVPIHVLPLRKLYGRTAISCGREMVGIIRRASVQVVHAHDFYSNIFAAPWARVGGAAFIASRRWWEGPDRRLQRWANRCAYVLANRVLANSASVGELLVRRERVRRNRVVIIPNFLDEDAFDMPPPGWVEAFRRDVHLPDGSVVIGVVASLSPIKDHGTLLRAVALLASDWPNLHVVLVGREAGSGNFLQQLAAELGIAARVHFAGARQNHPSAHHAFDISVLTSVSEGMPNSILEAMACGRPVVATAVGAVPDAISDGDNGFLVSAGDAEQLKDRLSALLQDPVLSHRMGARGRERAIREYSAASTMQALLATYTVLANEARPSLS